MCPCPSNTRDVTIAGAGRGAEAVGYSFLVWLFHPHLSAGLNPALSLTPFPFSVPARNQELILESYQELGWVRRIDNPLPGSIDVDPARKLHDAIVKINRQMKPALIRFRGDGTGKGVCWEEVTKEPG